MSRKGLSGMSFDQIMMQQISQDIDNPVYCRYCGDDVRKPRIHDHNNWNENMEWQIKYQTHTDCHQEHVLQQRRDFNGMA